MEGAWGFRDKGRLQAPADSAGRPPDVGVWIRDGRKWDLAVELTSPMGLRDIPASFGHHWWTWWASIQWEGRIGEDGVWSREEGQDCDVVAKTHGQNGMLVFVGALLWWGEAVVNAEETLEAWKEVVEDVTWALEEVVRSKVIG
ncbi:hypothetical protein C8J57DRAFT_1095028 [Mycena rebaudengoi]|nr:hypothetical protein C8J57DRAFT_1095028 [Mycena rebaudengoi]